MKQEAKQRQKGNKFQMKNTKPRSTNVNLPVNVNANNMKKKIDNVNTDFIRYISEREEKRTSTYIGGPPGNIKDEEEEE